MTIKELYNAYFDDIQKRIEHTFNLSQKQTSDIIMSFKNNMLDQLSDILEKSINKELKEAVQTSLVDSLVLLTKEYSNNSFDVIQTITTKTNDVTLFTITNPLFNPKTCENILMEYKTKIKEINTINNKFIKSFESLFELFLYKISINYKLKDEVTNYKLIARIINQNEKILLANLIDINNQIKNEIIKSFENNFVNFMDDVKELKEVANIKNKTILVEYSKDLLEEQANLSINKRLRSNCNEIGKVLTECHNQILNLENSKNIKPKQIALKEINNYFISFNNTLFDKSLKVILKMIEVLDCNKNDLEKNINKYNETIYKICDFEYNFERQFLNYKKIMLGKKPFTNKTNEQINKLLNETETLVIDIIKKSVIDLFKDSVTELNNVSYKTIMVEYKLKNYYEVIDSKIINKLFA